MKKMLRNCLLGVLCIMPLSVFAKTNINIECEKNELIAGETTKCTLKANAENPIGAVDVTVESDSSDLILSDFIANNDIWQGDADGGRFALYSDKSYDGNIIFGTFNIKASSNKNKIYANIKANESKSEIYLEDLNTISELNNIATKIVINPKSLTKTTKTILTVTAIAVVLSGVVFVVYKEMSKKK